MFKQASRSLFLKFDQVMTSFGFKENIANQGIYLTFSESKFIFLVLYIITSYLPILMLDYSMKLIELCQRPLRWKTLIRHLCVWHRKCIATDLVVPGITTKGIFVLSSHDLICIVVHLKKLQLLELKSSLNFSVLRIKLGKEKRYLSRLQLEAWYMDKSLTDLTLFMQ